MRLPLVCSVCLESGADGKSSTVFVAVQDSDVYSVHCRQGHTSTCVVMEPRYVQLYEIALYAIADGYMREAVSTFAACLERFYEFCVVALWTQSGIASSAVTVGWKPLSKQSERQLGAFCATYLLYCKTPPALLPPKAVELRNQVVHQGKIPSRSEAIVMGDAVLRAIHQNIQGLLSHAGSALSNHSLRLHLESLQAPTLKGVQVSRHSLAMAIRDLAASGSELHDTAYYLSRIESMERKREA